MYLCCNELKRDYVMFHIKTAGVGSARVLLWLAIVGTACYMCVCLFWDSEAIVDVAWNPHSAQQIAVLGLDFWSNARVQKVKVLLNRKHAFPPNYVHMPARIHFNSSGNRIYLFKVSGDVIVFDAETGNVMARRQVICGPVISCIVDDGLIRLLSVHGLLVECDSESLKETKSTQIIDTNSHQILSAAFGKGTRLAIIGGPNGNSVHFIDHDYHWVGKGPGDPLAVSCSDDGSFVVVCTDGAVVSHKWASENEPGFHSPDELQWQWKEQSNRDMQLQTCKHSLTWKGGFPIVLASATWDNFIVVERAQVNQPSVSFLMCARGVLYEGSAPPFKPLKWSYDKELVAGINYRGRVLLLQAVTPLLSR